MYIINLILTGISATAKITAYEDRIAFCKEHESCRIISVIKQLQLVVRLEKVQNGPIMHQLVLQPTTVHSIKDTPPKDIHKL